MKKPKTFNPNSDEHLEWVLKLAYRYVTNDASISTEEVQDALCDALCNQIGDDKFCELCEEEW